MLAGQKRGLLSGSQRKFMENKKEFLKENIFGLGKENTAYAKYILSASHILTR